MTFYRHRISGPGPAGDVWVTTLHSKTLAADFGGAHNAFITFATDFLNTYKALCTPQFHVTQLQTDHLDDVTGKNVNQAVFSVDITGTGTGDQPSPRACLVLSLKTALPTRAGRGRMYLPSPDSSHYQANGEFVAAMCQSVADAASAGLTTMSLSTIAQVYHRATKTGTEINQVRVGTVPGTQRRRTNKVSNAYSSSPIG